MAVLSRDWKPSINFDELSAQWSHGPVVSGRTFSLEEVGVQLGSNPGVSTSIFFSFIVFYPLAFYCLFSLLTPLASRDFCENVFLVLCTKIGSFHHIDASFFIVCPLIDHNIASWHCQSVVNPRARALGEWIYSRLPITRTLANSNLALTRTKIDFPWISVVLSL